MATKFGWILSQRGCQSNPGDAIRGLQGRGLQGLQERGIAGTSMRLCVLHDIQVKSGRFDNGAPPLNRSAGGGLAHPQFQAHFGHRHAQLMDRPVGQNAARLYAVGLFARRHHHTIGYIENFTNPLGNPFKGIPLGFETIFTRHCLGCRIEHCLHKVAIAQDAFVAFVMDVHAPQPGMRMPTAHAALCANESETPHPANRSINLGGLPPLRRAALLRIALGVAIVQNFLQCR
jgi:hypothetical protein